MSAVLLVWTNLPDEATAQNLAEKLIDARAAACVNQLAPCVSSYRWEGQIEHSEEVPLLIKTTEAAYPRVEALIRQAHPYTLPEIVATRIEHGLPAYLDWVRQETHTGDQE